VFKTIPLLDCLDHVQLYEILKLFLSAHCVCWFWHAQPSYSLQFYIIFYSHKLLLLKLSWKLNLKQWTLKH